MHGLGNNGVGQMVSMTPFGIMPCRPKTQSGRGLARGHDKFFGLQQGEKLAMNKKNKPTQPLPEPLTIPLSGGNFQRLRAKTEQEFDLAWPHDM